MATRISFAKAIRSPLKRQRKPWVRWLASWDWTDIPTCTTPQPRIITPMALMQEKMKSERLLTMASGSVPAARAGTLNAPHRARVKTAEK